MKASTKTNVAPKSTTLATSKQTSLIILIAGICTLVILSAVFVWFVLSEEPEVITENIDEIEFKRANNFGLKRYMVTTDIQSHSWFGSDVKIIESTNDENFVSYMRKKDGRMYNQKIHLSKAGLKVYSGKYVETYAESLRIVTD